MAKAREHDRSSPVARRGASHTALERHLGAMAPGRPWIGQPSIASNAGVWAALHLHRPISKFRIRERLRGPGESRP